MRQNRGRSQGKTKVEMEISRDGGRDGIRGPASCCHHRMDVEKRESEREEEVGKKRKMRTRKMMVVPM